MKLWTLGSRIFVLDGNGLGIRENDVVIQLSTFGLSHGFVRGKLAVSPDGQHVAFGPDEGSVKLWDSVRNDTVELANIENLTWLSETRVLAATKDRGLALFEFNPQPMGNDYLRQHRSIDPGIVRPVEWPTPDKLASIWRNLPAPAVGQKSAWELSVGTYGAAAVNQVTGVLVLLSPDSLEVSAALSVPAEYPETVIYVTALHNAFAVTHTGGRSMGGTNVFNYEGKWIRGVATHGLPSPLGLLSKNVLIQLVEESQFNSRLILRMLNSKNLNVLRTALTELDALNGYPTLHVGKPRIAIGDGRSYQVLDLASLGPS